jgi:membrane-associated protein
MFDVQSWLGSGGLILLAAIVFAESGLLIGFFLPGDTLLFVAGFLSSAAGGHVLPPLPITAGIAFAGAALGDQVGYMFGRRLGPSVFTRPRSRLFNPANALRAEAFFAQRGPWALVLARFVPIVRTFTSVVAGVGRMHYRTFFTFNLIGAARWAIGVTTLGAYLGEITFIRDNLEYAALVILAVSLAPVAIDHLRRARRARRGRTIPTRPPAPPPHP